jgi:hypothetical protein
MNFLLILFFLVPSTTPGAAPLEGEVARQLVRISSPSACAIYGAEQARKLAAATNTPHKVAHRCVPLGEGGMA